GYGDLIIGAPEAAWEGAELEGSYEAGQHTGAAMIVLGPVTGELDLDAADGWIQGTFVERGRISAYTGWSVAGVGDTNGDGFDDVPVGSPYYYDGVEATENYNGMAGLFLGPVEGVQDLRSADATWDAHSYCAWTGYDSWLARRNADPTLAAPPTAGRLRLASWTVALLVVANLAMLGTLLAVNLHTPRLAGPVGLSFLFCCRATPPPPPPTRAPRQRRHVGKAYENLSRRGTQGAGGPAFTSTGGDA
ncbi:MAG: integrin alpha, partial [Pseudomonadota bacterium]